MNSGIDKFIMPADQAAYNPRTFRTSTLRESLKKALLKQRAIGITRLNYLTPLMHLPFPVFSATRPHVHSLEVTATQGKGETIPHALLSALMEAAERHAGSRYSITQQSPYPQNADPNEWYFPLCPPGEERLAPLFKFQDIPFSIDIDWIRAHDFISDRPVWMPASLVLFPYDAPGMIRPTALSTTGLSAGNTLLEAAVHAMLEIIERHAVFEFLHHEAFQFLPLSHAPESVQGLIQKFTAAGAHLCIMRLPALYPTYFVSLLHLTDVSAPVAVIGQATHFSPEKAIQQALLEAAQSHAVSLQGSREDLIKDGNNWKEDESQLVGEWELAFEEAQRHPIDALDTPYQLTDLPGTIEGLMHFMLSTLQENGYKRVLAIPLTQPEVDIPVIRIHIPGLYETTVH